VKSDNTLDLEIRENYIKGCKFISALSINNFMNNKDWNNYFPLTKQAMDLFFTSKKKEEREFQQVVVRENNYSSIANGTDYFIVDIEYDNHKNARFDLVAIEWPSKATHRKLSGKFKPKVVVIEMKFGDGALKNKSGLRKHYSDWQTFLTNKAEVNSFKKEIINLFQQKRDLGLIPCLYIDKNSNKIMDLSDDMDFAFLFANHDPASTKLRTELYQLVTKDIKCITSNFLGYGLYLENNYELKDFVGRFEKQL
jgi:hypothetical protein